MNDVKPDANDTSTNTVEHKQEPPENSTAESERPADLVTVSTHLQAASENFSRQNQEYRNIRNTQNQLEDALSRVMTSIEKLQSPPSTEAARAVHTSDGRLITEPGDCGCRDRCIDDSCCCFDVMFERVRVLTAQSALSGDVVHDSATTTGLAGTRSGLECQFFIEIDGSGIIVPNQVWETLQLRKRIGKAGAWYHINRRVNRLCLPKHGKKIFRLRAQAVEREEGREEALVAGLDEFGSASVDITLDCCCDHIGPFHLPIELIGGGAGGGELEAVFEAVRV